MLRPSVAVSNVLLRSAVAVAAVGAAACGAPETRDTPPPPEDTKPSLGSITADALLDGLVEHPFSSYAYDAIEVRFSRLGACDDRAVELRAVDTAADDETVEGGALPSRVPATGAEPVVTFTAAEVIAARGGLNASGLEAVLRCGDDEIERRFVELSTRSPVAGIGAQMTPTGTKLDDFFVVDDGGLLVLSSTLDAVDDTITHVFLDAFDKDGVRRGTASDLGPFDAVSYGFVQNAARTVAGPGIDRLADGQYLVRLYDDQRAPTAAFAAVVDNNGAVVREYADRAVLQATLVGERLVFLLAPIVTDPEQTGDVVIEIIDNASGTTIVNDIATDLTFVELLGLQSTGVSVIAASDDGVDITIGGVTYQPAVLIARDGLAPVTVEVPDNGGGLVTLTALPGVTDGRFIAGIGDATGDTTAFSIIELNATSDGFDTVEALGTLPGFVANGGIVASRTLDAVVIGLVSDVVNANGSDLGHYVYFKDGAFVCSMLSTAPGDSIVTITDDDQLIVSGSYVVTCDDEREIDIGTGVSLTSLDGGIVEPVGNFENSVWTIEWLPLDTLIALAPSTVRE